MDMRVNICGVELKNPITTASGTFGFGHEYGAFFDLSMLGGIGVKGLTPTASAAGIIAFAVAACEYRSAEAKKSTTASSHGHWVSKSPAVDLMPSMCALIRVEPSQATPMTQTVALMPDLNTCVPGTSAAGILATATISPAVASMMAMIASLRGSEGSVISPIWSEIKVA